MRIPDKMKAFAEEREAKRRTYPVAELPPLQSLPTLAWLGTFSYNVPAFKTRYAIDRVLVRPFGFPQTPTELARDYLMAKYVQKNRQYHDQYLVNDYQRGWPHLAKPGRYPDMVYIDLKAAYWSIMQIVGWDVEYYPGKFLGKRSIMNDFLLPENKLGRNSLVSTAASSTINVWTGTRVENRKVGGKMRNPQVASLVGDVLHGIAADMRDLGAVYIHTDGYILPRFMAGPALRLISDGWGIPARIKHEGYCVVKGVGAYSVGTKVSRTLGVVDTEATEYILPRQRGWLREKLLAWRERTLLFYGDDTEFNDADYQTWRSWSM